MSMGFPGLLFPLRAFLLATALTLAGLYSASAKADEPPLPLSSPAPFGDTTGGTAQAAIRLEWRKLAPGVDLAVLESSGGNSIRITAIRIDPGLYDFSLHSITWDGEPPLSIEEWAEKQGLVAAINAGMYLPDGHTNTGYMRRGKLFNNARIAEKFGSFFVSGPRFPGLPQAVVLDRALPGWDRMLPQYDNVVQNFRLLGPGGVQLWPEKGPLHPVAAVGVDRTGNILFLHCRTLVTVHRFVQALLACPDLQLAAAMYVEGGAQAAMVVRLPGFSQTWVGQHPADLLFGNSGIQIPLPNIIGVRQRRLP